MMVTVYSTLLSCQVMPSKYSNVSFPFIPMLSQRGVVETHFYE